MRKSQSIAIGLLATSIASCSTQPVHRHPVIGAGGSWSDNDTTNNIVYVDDGYGYVPTYYHHTYYHPIFVNYGYGYYNGHISNRTSVVYRTSSGSYNATSGGRVGHSSSSHSSGISRGGFGSSGHSVSS
jgi:hypothetical protein